MIIKESDEESGTGQAPPPHTPQASAKPAEKEKHGQKQVPAKLGEPDEGEWHYHTVHQGLITFRKDSREKILMPWQVIPFSEGWDFLAAKYSIRFHRGVYQVGAAGNMKQSPGEIQTEQIGSVAYARNAWAYVTPADSICGFTGIRFARTKVTCERVRTIRDLLSRFEKDEQPWKSKTVEMLDLRSVLPTFWIEMDEPAEGFRSSNVPLSQKQDITTGKVVTHLVKLEDWHLLAPIPGIMSDVVMACERAHGDRFMMNRIYLGGTGIGPRQDLCEHDVTGDGNPVFLELDDLINSTVGKLTSVITPCLSVERQPRKNDPSKPKTEPPPIPGEQHEMFSIPSLTALRNMLGDRTIVGTSVLSN